MTTAEPLFSTFGAGPSVAAAPRRVPVRDPLSVLDEYAAFETIDKLELRDLAAAVNVSHSWSELIETSGAWKRQYLKLPLLPAEKWRHSGAKFPQLERPRDILVGLEGDEGHSTDGTNDTTDWKRLSLTHLATEARWAEGRSTIRDSSLPQGGFLQFAGVDEGSDALIFVERALTIEVADFEDPTPLPSIGGPSRLHVVDRTTLAVRASYPVPHGPNASFGTRRNIGLYINRPINGRTVSLFVPGYTADRFALQRRCSKSSPFQPLLGTEMKTTRDHVFPFVDSADDAPRLMAAQLHLSGGDEDAVLSLSHVKAPDALDLASEIPIRISDSHYDVLIDDEFVVVPTGFQVDVYMRSGQHILTYLANEHGEPQRRLAGALYEIPHQDISQKRYTPLRGSPRVVTPPSAAPGTAKSLAASGVRHGQSDTEDERFQRGLDAVFWDAHTNNPHIGQGVLREGGSFATGNTLYLRFIGTGTVVVPEYRRVFREAAARPWSQRASYVADRAVALAAPTGSVFVAHGTRFAICQPNEIHLFNVADLPSMPLAAACDVPPLRGKTIVGHTNDARYLSRMSPLGFEMDSRAIYELIDVGDPLSGLAMPRFGGYRLPRFGLRVFSFEPKG